MRPDPTPPAAPPASDATKPNPPKTFAAPRLPEPYGRIVTTVFDMPDPFEEFTRLRDELSFSAVKPSRADYGTVVDALDDAEKNAHRAVELVVNFEAVAAAFEMDAVALSGPMREQAKARLEQEKRDEFEKAKAELGSKAPTGKQITEADVLAAVASMFPDDARELAISREKTKGALEAARSLAARWAERARDLRVMVGTVRNAPH